MITHDHTLLLSPGHRGEPMTVMQIGIETDTWSAPPPNPHFQEAKQVPQVPDAFKGGSNSRQTKARGALLTCKT